MKKIVLKVLALFFISFTVVLAGCGSSPGDKFLGTWNKGDDQFETYLVIEKSPGQKLARRILAYELERNAAVRSSLVRASRRPL